MFRLRLLRFAERPFFALPSHRDVLYSISFNFSPDREIVLHVCVKNNGAHVAKTVRLITAKLEGSSTIPPYQLRRRFPMVKKVHRRFFSRSAFIAYILCNYVSVRATISRYDYETPRKIKRTILIYIPISSVAFFHLCNKARAKRC